MRRVVLIGILAVLVMCGGGLAYEITRVVEVGPADNVPFVWPLKWSPDGSLLAYISGGSLRVTDTLGASRDVVRLEMTPFRMEWSSHSEILIHAKRSLPDDTDLHRIVCVHVDSPAARTSREYLRLPGVRPIDRPESFSGPYRSLEGNIYYRTNVIQATTHWHQRDREGVNLEVAGLDKSDDAALLAANHFVDWRPDGLYMISCDLSDSVRLAKSLTDVHINEPAVDKTISYYLDGRFLCRIKDSTVIQLDTFILEFPPRTGAAGFLYGSFNPKAPEALFEIVFGDSDNYEVSRIGTFDYSKNVLTVIDTLIGMEGCDYPAYAPDGRKIAFLHSGKLYILYRTGVQ